MKISKKASNRQCFLRHKIKTFESPLDKKNVIECINRLKNYFSVDSKNTDDTTHFDPDFFQNLIARVGIGIRMSWVENL